MTTARLSVTHPLPTGAGLDVVEALLAERSSAWELPAGQYRHWVMALAPHLPRPDDVELYLEFDPVTDLATIELWKDGSVLFGIDDWVGSW